VALMQCQGSQLNAIPFEHGNFVNEFALTSSDLYGLCVRYAGPTLLERSPATDQLKYNPGPVSDEVVQAVLREHGTFFTVEVDGSLCSGGTEGAADTVAAYDVYMRYGGFTALEVLEKTSRSPFALDGHWLDRTQGKPWVATRFLSSIESRQSEFLKHFTGTGELAWLPDAPGRLPNARAAIESFVQATRALEGATILGYLEAVSEMSAGKGEHFAISERVAALRVIGKLSWASMLRLWSGHTLPSSFLIGNQPQLAHFLSE
jgi:hypothetical protein